MAKFIAGECAERVASQAIEWCGGIAFTKEFASEKYYRDAKIGKKNKNKNKNNKEKFHPY